MCFEIVKLYAETLKLCIKKVLKVGGKLEVLLFQMIDSQMLYSLRFFSLLRRRSG